MHRSSLTFTAANIEREKFARLFQPDRHVSLVDFSVYVYDVAADNASQKLSFSHSVEQTGVLLTPVALNDTLLPALNPTVLFAERTFTLVK